jgi:hypothetical protein
MIHFRVADAKEKHFNEFRIEAELNNRVKADWGDVDHLFLRDNPNFRTLKIFKKIITFLIKILIIILILHLKVKLLKYQVLTMLLVITYIGNTNI